MNALQIMNLTGSIHRSLFTVLTFLIFLLRRTSAHIVLFIIITHFFGEESHLFFFPSIIFSFELCLVNLNFLFIESIQMALSADIVCVTAEDKANNPCAAVSRVTTSTCGKHTINNHSILIKNIAFVHWDYLSLLRFFGRLFLVSRRFGRLLSYFRILDKLLLIGSFCFLFSQLLLVFNQKIIHFRLWCLHRFTTGENPSTGFTYSHTAKRGIPLFIICLAKFEI